MSAPPAGGDGPDAKADLGDLDVGIGDGAIAHAALRAFRGRLSMSGVRGRHPRAWEARHEVASAQRCPVCAGSGGFTQDRPIMGGESRGGGTMTEGAQRDGSVAARTAVRGLAYLYTDSGTSISIKCARYCPSRVQATARPSLISNSSARA